jgi:hypothetical protein
MEVRVRRWHSRRMMRIRFRRVHPDKVERLRAWLAEAGGPRREEAVATLRAEGVRHETASLLMTAQGPVVAYAVEADDFDHVNAAFANSPFPIDEEHRRVMDECLAGPAESELLLDIAP